MPRIKLRESEKPSLLNLYIGNKKVIESIGVSTKFLGLTKSQASKLFKINGRHAATWSKANQRKLFRYLRLRFSEDPGVSNADIFAIWFVFRHRFRLTSGLDINAVIEQANNRIGNSDIGKSWSPALDDKGKERPSKLLKTSILVAFCCLAIPIASVFSQPNLSRSANESSLSSQLDQNRAKEQKTKPTILLYLQPPSTSYAVGTNKMIRYEVEAIQKKFRLSSIEIQEQTAGSPLNSQTAEELRLSRGVECIIWLDLIELPAGKQFYAYMIYPNAGYAELSTVFTIKAKDLDSYEILNRQIRVFNGHLADILVGHVLESGDINLAKQIIQYVYSRSDYVKSNRILYAREGYIYELEGRYNDALKVLDNTMPVPFPEGVDGGGLSFDDTHRARLLYKLNRFEEAYLCLSPSIKGVPKGQVKFYPDEWACSSMGVIFLLVTTPYSTETKAIIMYRPRKDVLVVIDAPNVPQFLSAFSTQDSEKQLLKVALQLEQANGDKVPPGLYYTDKESDLSTDSKIKFLPQRIDSLKNVPGW